MKGKISLFLGIGLLFGSLTGIFADPLPPPVTPFSLLPSAYGASGFFGLSYGVGEGADIAINSLLETGSHSSRISGTEEWGMDLFSQWLITKQLGTELNLTMGPLSFSILGYDNSGSAEKGIRYSFLNMDAAILLFYRRNIGKGFLSVTAGPLLGVRLGNGLVLLKSEDVISQYSVIGKQIPTTSLGVSLSGRYSYPAGPGFIDMGLKIAYHYTSVKGLLTKESVNVNIVAPLLSVGYSLRGRK